MPVYQDEEPVVDWSGMVLAYPPGAELDDYFQVLDIDGGRFGIGSLDPSILSIQIIVFCVLRD